MRFKLTLKPHSTTDKQNRVLIPENYHFKLAEWFRAVFNTGATSFQRWATKEGVLTSRSAFELYTFSHLQITDYKLFNKTYHILSDTISCYVSCYPHPALEKIIPELLLGKQINIEDYLSGTIFGIEAVELQTAPAFEEKMHFKSISPILVSYKDHTATVYAEYMFPKGERYNELFISMLYEKAHRYQQQLAMSSDILATQDEAKFAILSSPKACIITLYANTRQELQLLAYHYEFSMNAPAEILKFAYYTGFGEENNMGFGCATNA